jgi:hypothetical protein
MQVFGVVMKLIVRADHDHFTQIADEVSEQQQFDFGIAFQTERTRDQHRHFVGSSLRCNRHCARFRDIASHPRFAQHMLASRQGRAGHFRMQVGPRADDHGVDLIVGDQGLPIGIASGDAEFVRNALGRFGSSIGDANHFDTRDGSQTGNVPPPRIVTCPYDSNSKSIRHAVLNLDRSKCNCPQTRGRF